MSSGQSLRIEADDPLQFRHVPFHVEPKQLEKDRFLAVEVGVDRTLRIPRL